jgi:hypothetical protein
MATGTFLIQDDPQLVEMEESLQKKVLFAVLRRNHS